MNEAFLHYLWKFGLFSKNNLFTTDNEQVIVLNSGLHNTNAGPDFTNARIKINETIWVGNVEIHINASDWKKHHHQNNKDYDTVILQVVKNADAVITRTNGEIIPTLILPIDPTIWHNYTSLLTKPQNTIACYDKLNQINEFTVQFWINKLSVERLEQKSEHILSILSQNKNNLEETFYQILLRSFGFGLNTLPFELLAQRTPLTYIQKHAGNLLQTEALLMGQAGFLNDAIEEDDYYLKLQKEYQFLQHKYNLTPIEKHLWKFLRLRPVNFPTVRIAQVAALLNRQTQLFSQIITITKISDLEKLFAIETSNYWDTHYTFGKKSATRNKTIGAESLHTLYINAIIPTIFTYGILKNDESKQELALNLLEELKPEKNNIITEWKSYGITARNAAQSQALIYLKQNYCNLQKCLNCQIGHELINV